MKPLPVIPDDVYVRHIIGDWHEDGKLQFDAFRHSRDADGNPEAFLSLYSLGRWRIPVDKSYGLEQIRAYPGKRFTSEHRLVELKSSDIVSSLESGVGKDVFEKFIHDPQPVNMSHSGLVIAQKHRDSKDMAVAEALSKSPHATHLAIPGRPDDEELAFQLDEYARKADVLKGDFAAAKRKPYEKSIKACLRFVEGQRPLRLGALSVDHDGNCQLAWEGWEWRAELTFAGASDIHCSWRKQGIRPQEGIFTKPSEVISFISSRGDGIPLGLYGVIFGTD